MKPTIHRRVNHTELQKALPLFLQPSLEMMTLPAGEIVAVVFSHSEKVIVSSHVRRAIESLGNIDEPVRIAGGYGFTIEALGVLQENHFLLLNSQSQWFWTDESWKRIRQTKISRLCFDPKYPPFPCPCCGYLVFGDWPGTYEICSICYWEDDPVQLLDPSCAGGANRVSLREAQKNFQIFGTCEERFQGYVRPAGQNDRRDPFWHVAPELSPEDIRTPAMLSREEFEDLKIWYYWKRSRFSNQVQ